MTAVSANPSVAGDSDPQVGQLAGVSGYLLDADGEPLSEGTLTLNVLEPLAEDGDVVASRVADSVVTAGDGYFDLSTDVSGAVRDWAGRVQLELVYQSAPGEPGLVYDFPASPPFEPGTPWTIEVPGSVHVSPEAGTLNGFDLVFMLGNGALTAEQLLDPDLVADTVIGLLPELTMSTATDDSITVPNGESDAEESEGLDIDEPAVRLPTASSTSCPSPYTMFWDAKDVFRYNYVPTKWFRTRDNSRQQWVYERSHESTFGLAFDADGSKYQGGMAGSRYEKTGLSFKPEVGNNAHQFFKVRTKYQKWRAYCYYSEIEQPYTDSYWLDLWKWAPRELTGGNKKVDTSSSITCGDGPEYVDSFGAETTISRESSASYNNSFTIIGVRLDSRTLDRSYQSFTVYPDAGVNAKYCGSNKAPMYANFAKEY